MPGVTVTMAEIAVLVLFTGIKELILPVPFAGSPIAVLLLVQVKVFAVPEKFMAEVGFPEVTT